MAYYFHLIRSNLLFIVTKRKYLSIRAHESKKSDTEPLISACDDDEEVKRGFDATGKKSFHLVHRSANITKLRIRLVLNII